MQRKSFIRGLFLALLTLSLAATAAAPVLAKDGRKSYIVVLAGAPIATYEGGLTGYARTKAPEGKRVAVNTAPARKYEKFLTSEHNKSLKTAGVGTAAKLHDYTVSLNGYSAVLTPKQVDAIRTQKGVLHVFEDQMRQPATDSSGKFLGLTARGGAYASGFTGEDVVVGVIDTGIWPEHPSFADDGTYPSPSAVSTIPGLPCDFGNTAHNPNDAPFTCNNKLLGARQMLDTYRVLHRRRPRRVRLGPRRQRPRHAHRLHGGRQRRRPGRRSSATDRGKITGIAPRAQIIAYKGLGNLGGFTSDLAAAIDQAVADGVDVINYSIGGGAEPARRRRPRLPVRRRRRRLRGHLGRQRRPGPERSAARRRPVGDDGRGQHPGAASSRAPSSSATARRLRPGASTDATVTRLGTAAGRRGARRGDDDLCCRGDLDPTAVDRQDRAVPRGVDRARREEPRRVRGRRRRR